MSLPSVFRFKERLGALVGALKIALATAMLWFPVTVTAEGSSSKESMPVDIESIELASGASEALPRLLVVVRNRSSEPVVGWTFEILVAGKVVDGYRDLMVLKAVPPGEAATLELYRLEPPSSPFELEVKVLEAWTGKEVAVEESSIGAEEDELEWRLIAPLDGRVSAKAAFGKTQQD